MSDTQKVVEINIEVEGGQIKASKCMCVAQACNSFVFTSWKVLNKNILRNIFFYNKNIRIIKVKWGTRTFFLTKLCKINYKKLRTYVEHSTGARHRDNTVLVSSEDTSAPTVIENLKYLLRIVMYLVFANSESGRSTLVVFLEYTKRRWCNFYQHHLLFLR